MARARSKNSETSSADLRYEAKLWLAAGKLRGNMDAAEYKHVVLGLIFLRNWLKGYAGHDDNERCDVLPNEAIAKIKKTFSSALKAALSQLAQSDHEGSPADNALRE